VHERKVTVTESGHGPYGQYITAGNHVIGADEPIELGGNNTGPYPYELLLSALGACTAMTIRMYAERRKLRLERVEVQLRHAQRANVQGGLADRFERVVTLTGELSTEERQKLIEIAEKCPVSQTLQRSSMITTLSGADQPSEQ
jgi:putative redox protein